MFPVSVLAGNDLTFTCDDSSCTKSSSLPLFSETNIYPTYTVNQKTTIINNRSTNCNLNFKLINQTTPDILSSVLTISSVTDSTIWYSGTISSLFDDQNHILGSISANSSKDISWTTVFNQDAGNDYQNQSNLFDMDFNFTCDDPPSSPPSSSAPVCNDTTPTEIPQNFSATSGQNSVTLNWTKPTGSFTYYLIAFSNTSSADKYGNPNIGGPDTTSYTVNGLSSGTTYYFKIRTGNGCAPGSFSSIISATPGGLVLANPAIPAGFQEGVLGVETSTPVTSPEIPSILGTQSSNSTCHWVFKYLFILIILTNILFRKNKIIALILTGILVVVDYFLIDQNCRWWFWYLLDLFSFALPFLILK